MCFQPALETVQSRWRSEFVCVGPAWRKLSPHVFSVTAPTVWNQLTVNTTTASTLGTFKAKTENRTVYSRIPHIGQFIAITTVLPILIPLRTLHLSHISSLMLAWCKEGTVSQVLSYSKCCVASVVAQSIVLYRTCTGQPAVRGFVSLGLTHCDRVFLFFRGSLVTRWEAPWWVWSLFRSVAGQLYLQCFDAVGWVFSPVKLSPG